ncbi:MAG: PAS domain S-box protein, partial [Acidobacteria bacterium]|nr:PAS domain S-box protein [Acidobacteriota bacterium]
DRRHMLRRDGSVFYADGVTCAAIVDDECAGFSKILRDAGDMLRTETRLNMQIAVGRHLDPYLSFSTTSRSILRTVCESLGWELGAFRTIYDDRLVCVERWHAESVDEDVAARLSGGFEFEKGEGMPGTAWERAEPVWVTDFTDSVRFPRAPVALEAGLAAAFAFPITSGSGVLGVMEFFGREQRPPDEELLRVMTVVGSQVGKFFEQREMLHNVRRSEELYRLVSETAQEVILTIDEHSTILTCNQAAERILGWKPDELVGRDLGAIIPERLRDAHYSGMRHYMETGSRRIPWQGLEMPALHKDGHEVPAEISFGEWSSERGRIFSGFVRDVSERKKASEELTRALVEEKAARDEADAANQQLSRRAEEEAAFARLAAVLNGVVELEEILDEITGRATDLTRADGVYIERIVENQPGQMKVVVAWARGAETPKVGLEVEFPGSLTEEILRDRKPLIMADTDRFGQKMAPYLSEACPQCELLVAPLFAAEQPLGALVLLNSRRSGRTFGSTDLDRATTLADLASLALRRVRLMQEERTAKEQAQAAVQAREETLGVVSHDLRNPISKIALSAQLLQEADEEELPELVETIVDGARQAERLIQDLLDVARFEAGRFSVDLQEVDIDPFVREVCVSHEPLATRKQQTLECEIQEGLPPIPADRLRLIQVFDNLLGNAMKFTPEDGVITISASREQNQVRFSVTDSGPGIPESDLPNLFSGYWQARRTAHLGAGFGLAIVRGIVEAHGGTVSARNQPEGGARISFTLPLQHTKES